ncbi:MAG: M28 family peptidase, partial [Candidatus Thorarchaeota archaeon]
MPNTVSTNSISDEPQIVELMEPADSLQRVYGVDLSLEIFESVDQNRYRGYVRDFTANGSRHIYGSLSIAGSENEISRHWLVNKMTELSDDRLEIELVGEYMNIVGRLPGYLPGEKPVFVIGAHYDTMPLTPGANDDGSGIAAVLELLGIMSQYEWPLDIYFIAFNGANALYEQLTPVPGLFQGSPEVAEAFTDAGIEIMAFYNIDTILRPATHAQNNDRLLLVYNENALYYHISQYWAELGETISNWYGSDTIGAISSMGFTQWYRSDHIKFIMEGYDSVILAFESGFNIDTAYQTEDDVWDRSEYAYYLGSETTSVIGASMAYIMGKAYGERTQLFNVQFVSPGTSYKYYFPVSMATTLNITARWYGASATFLLYAPGDILIAASSQPTHPWEFTQLFSYFATQEGLYYLQVWNTGTEPLGVDTYIEYDVDINGNGVSDQYEYWLDSSLFEQDSDSDSISDAMEIIYG